MRKAFAKYLKWGIFAHSFARARCDDCAHDLFVAFSCKGRGVCPSCTTRHIAETAAHLFDHVFLRLPVRHCAAHVEKGRLHIGAVALAKPQVHIHRFGSSLNEHVHFHVCVVDGVFEEVAGDGVTGDKPSLQGVIFHRASDIDAGAVTQVHATLRRRILRGFVGRGLLESFETNEYGGKQLLK